MHRDCKRLLHCTVSNEIAMAIAFRPIVIGTFVVLFMLQVAPGAIIPSVERVSTRNKLPGGPKLTRSNFVRASVRKSKSESSSKSSTSKKKEVAKKVAKAAAEAYVANKKSKKSSKSKKKGSTSASSDSKKSATSNDTKNSSCFPGSSTVSLQDGRTIHMDQLSVGDMVLSGLGKYSPVNMCLRIDCPKESISLFES